jgi:hypothetical protein
MRTILDVFLDWTHSADGRPSGSSLQVVEQIYLMDLNKSETLFLCRKDSLQLLCREAQVELSLVGY